MPLAQALLVPQSMREALSELREMWRRFARAQPGERFVNHHREAQRTNSVAKRVVRLTLGTILTAAGMTMWFTPGPGWLLVLFGLAMFAAESSRLALVLD